MRSFIAEFTVFLLLARHIWISRGSGIAQGWRLTYLEVVLLDRGQHPSRFVGYI